MSHAVRAPDPLSKYEDDGLCGAFRRIVRALNSIYCQRIEMNAACYLQWAGRRRTSTSAAAVRGAIGIPALLLSCIEQREIRIISGSQLRCFHQHPLNMFIPLLGKRCAYRGLG